MSDIYAETFLKTVESRRAAVNRIAQLEAENKHLLDSAHAKSEECNRLAAQVIELRNENARLREALSQLVRQADTFGCEGHFWDVARQALVTDTNKKEGV